MSENKHEHDVEKKNVSETEQTVELESNTDAIEKTPMPADEATELVAETEREIPISNKEAERHDEAVDADEPNNEYVSLLNELTLLRAQLEEKDRELESLCVQREMAEFNELFPNTPIDSLPDSVLEKAKEGLPLAASYALYKRRAELRLEKAEEINKRNGAMSTGAIERDTTDSFYTPNEVKAMSRSEIRKNYQKILESMKKWN
jgi:hypothetical protein